MTDYGKIQMVKAMAGEEDDDVISAYLFVAEQSIRSRLFGSSVKELPAGYEGLLIQATVYLLNRRDADGELSHSENGVSISYEDAYLPDSLFRGYTAKAEVVG
jgi:hypothetical protein